MKTLYTIGYQNLKTVAQLREIAEGLDALVADIRQVPYARKNRQFDTGNLVQEMPARYKHLQAFGNLNYNTGGPIKINNFEQGLSYIRPFLETRNIILLCGCWNVETCHRKVVAEMLKEQLGCPVEHLTGKEVFR